MRLNQSTTVELELGDKDLKRFAIYRIIERPFQAIGVHCSKIWTVKRGHQFLTNKAHRSRHSGHQ